MRITKNGVLSVAIATSLTGTLLTPAWAEQLPDMTTTAVEESDAVEADHPEPSCLMPIHGVISTTSGTTKTSSGKTSGKPADRFCVRVEMRKPLSGNVDGSDSSDPLTKMSYRLTEANLDRNPQVKVVEKAVTRYKRAHERAIATSKDALDKLVCYRGFGPSSQAGDVLLEDKLKLDNLQAAEFVRQKQVDDAHISTVQILMHLATGVGNADPDRRKKIMESGIAELTKQVGEDEAKQALDELKSWSRMVRVAPEVYEKNFWDPLELEAKQKLVVESALKSDPVFIKVKQKLGKYNHKSKFTMAASHVIEGTLGVAAMVPNIMGPAAQIALTVFETSTGGPEEAKLIKEIYLYKRLESRSKVLSKKAQIALHNYQLGVASKNPLQIAFAQAMISEMAGADTVQEVFGHSVLDSLASENEGNKQADNSAASLSRGG